MKVVKFKPHLCDLILSGVKTSTWRLFDDKDLQRGDEVLLCNSESLQNIARAKIISCSEKELGGVTDEDYEGHERYKSTMDMFEHFSDYYGNKVNEHSPLKIIRFELLEKLPTA